MARPETPRFHGFLIVDKPAGWTSHDVVARIRRLTRQRAVGHTGTLDPAATGILPIALGDATKVLSIVDDASKTYLAEITFGVETDTYDADGRVIRQMDPTNLTNEVVSKLVTSFVGTIRQQVPKYSAVQRAGRRLHDLARAGVDFEPPWREVVIHDIDIVDLRMPVLTLCVDCGAGTYIRSLAHDLGRAAGSCAYLSDLVRLRSGSFSLADAWTLEELARIPLDDEWATTALHPDSAILQTPAIILAEADRLRWKVGKAVGVSANSKRGLVRAYSDTGHWLGTGVIETRQGEQMVQPRRVIESQSSIIGGEQSRGWS